MAQSAIFEFSIKYEQSSGWVKKHWPKKIVRPRPQSPPPPPPTTKKIAGCRWHPRWLFPIIHYWCGLGGPRGGWMVLREVYRPQTPHLLGQGSPIPAAGL